VCKPYSSCCAVGICIIPMKGLQGRLVASSHVPNCTCMLYLTTFKRPVEKFLVAVIVVVHALSGRWRVP
jgi:hypothetical protein